MVFNADFFKMLYKTLKLFLCYSKYSTFNDISKG